MKNVLIVAFVLVTLSSCSAIAKKPFMCCATKTSFRCTQEIPADDVVVGEPGEICAVSTDILKAQQAAQSKIVN